MFDRWVEDGLLQAVEEEGIGCIAFSPLAQGVLTDRYLGGTIPADSRAARGHFLRPEQITQEKLAVIEALNDIAQARGQKLAQMALAWVLRHSAMTSVLIGASRTSQVLDAIGAANGPAFSADELARIGALIAKV
jgi:L-glyceraldehyde 3-phosphate reductase